MTRQPPFLKKGGNKICMTGMMTMCSTLEEVCSDTDRIDDAIIKLISRFVNMEMKEFKKDQK